MGRAIRAKGNGDARKTYGNILSYARKFPQREMGVMLVSDMQRAVGQEIFDTPEFDQWAQDVSDIMLFNN